MWLEVAVEINHLRKVRHLHVDFILQSDPRVLRHGHFCQCEVPHILPVSLRTRVYLSEDAPSLSLELSARDETLLLDQALVVSFALFTALVKHFVE